MMRIIHFFKLKPGASEKRLIELSTGELAEYLLAHGCVERRTMKLLDAEGRSERADPYLQEALWPDPETADRAMSQMPEEIKRLLEELLANIEVDERLTLRYLDAQ